MSELTPCNHCTLKTIRNRARTEGEKVTVVRDKERPGALFVLVHPPDVKAEYERESPYFRAWFMALTEHCVC